MRSAASSPAEMTAPNLLPGRRAGCGPRRGSRDVRQKPKPPTYESLLDAIAGAPSAADLAVLRATARTFFMGTQRETLEAAAAARRAELPDGEAVEDA